MKYYLGLALEWLIWPAVFLYFGWYTFTACYYCLAFGHALGQFTGRAEGRKECRIVYRNRWFSGSSDPEVRAEAEAMFQDTEGQS